jgi:hypothetical protein
LPESVLKRRYRSTGKAVSCLARPTALPLWATSRLTARSMILYMARTFPGSATDPHGLERLSRSRAQTPAGIERLFNKVAKEWGLGEPTRAEVRASRAEARGQKLKPQQIDRNAYRHPVVRARPPRDMPKRRAPGWAATNFVLPKATIMGLSFLARSIADKERAQRASQPYGLKRLYPKTRNFYVLQALNHIRTA